MKKNYLLIIVFLFYLSCNPYKSINSFQRTFFAFHTAVTITIVDKNLNSEKFNDIIEDLTIEAERYDLIFNTYNKKSEIYHLKKFKKNKFYQINRELYEVIKKSKKYYYLTDRAFDVTIGKITMLYDFEKKKIPSEKEIQDNLEFVGMDKVILSNGKIKLLKENITIDLGGIAKGYIIDKFSEFIKNKKYKNYMVNIGGDIYASGKNMNEKKWVIGVRNPEEKETIVKKIEVSGQAIVTSGDYERYLRRQKKKYHHILNPETCMLARNNIVNVTVISEKTVDADCIATARFVIGVEKSKIFIEKNFKNNVEYYIITKTKQGFEIISNKM